MSRSPAAVQGRLAFEARALRRERAFKRMIVMLTVFTLAGLVAGTSAGRYGARVLALQVRTLFDKIIGLPPNREIQEQLIRETRSRNAGSARRALAQAARPGSALDSFLKTVGMDATSAVIRWGNINRPIVLSSAVFEPDDERSYRLKPGVRSIWVIGLSLRDSAGMFLVPDTPEARQSAARAGGRPVPSSVQTTNSWGCRGPEPDPNAPVRVLVLGDSMMQGMLVGDDETPPARLQAHLSSALQAPVSVLNTGHVGYSPEQYDQTLRAFGDRFGPHLVILSIIANDIDRLDDPASWAEAEFAIDQIDERCRMRGWKLLVVPTPEALTLLGRRDFTRFPGPLSRIFKHGGDGYVDPMESLVDGFIRARNDELRRDTGSENPLFNFHLLGDRHFSPLGSDLWARVVARRLLLVWDGQVLNRMPAPEPVIRHARAAHPVIPGDEVQRAPAAGGAR
jgi:hypothetical protein